MSGAQKNTPKRFNYTPTGVAPKAPVIATTWDLKKLYYKGDNDPRIEADVAATEGAYTRFAKKWRSKAFTTNTKLLKQALSEYEAMAGDPAFSRPLRYYSFRLTLNASDDAAEKASALISRRLRKAGDQIRFFTLELGKIPKGEQTKLLKAGELTHFRYYLEHLFSGAAHHLSEAEEKIISLKSRQAYGMWVDMVEKLLSKRDITYKGTQLAVPEALEAIDTLKSAEKPKLWNKIVTEMEQIGEIAEHEFNAIITDVRTEDELRGYKKPYSATALNYEDTEASIESLVSAVSTEGFKLSKQFYKLKAQYHDVDALHYSQKYDSIGVEPVITFNEAVEICRDVFYGLKPEYGEIFDKMLTHGQIDVFPKKGKRGGAFMSGDVGHPTQVMLNHVSNFKSLETLAHEMGHAIHSERSKTQSPFYEGHSIITAETASTLFENLVFDAVYAQANEAEKMVLLHDRITRDIATIERQIAFFNAELEIHTTIHEKGAMTNQELAKVMEKHLKSYLGPAVTVRELDGYSYVYIPHLRYGFYVYTYSFGILMSTIMANHYKVDTRYIDEIDRFLSAGASASVADIFKLIGINTTKPDTFTEALKNHATDIKTFAQFVKKR